MSNLDQKILSSVITSASFRTDSHFTARVYLNGLIAQADKYKCVNSRMYFTQLRPNLL